MQVSIYKVPASLDEWVPTVRPYQFEPVAEDDQPVAVVDCPSGWMLVGAPHALLVLRTGDHEFTTRTANDVLTLASGGADGFSFVVAPKEGAAGAVNAVRVAASISASRLSRDQDKAMLGLPESNGKALVAPRKKR